MCRVQVVFERLSEHGPRVHLEVSTGKCKLCPVVRKDDDIADVKAVQESDESMQDAINAAVDHAKRQAQKHRKMIRDHKQKGRVKSAPEAWAVQVLEPSLLRGDGDSRPRIIKTSNLPIRPMSIEHAALLLDDSKNEFIVFRDVDTDKVSVIYKRRDNNLGLIAPEF